MADALRSLTKASSFSVLQEKLESWQKDYHVISCDQNLSRCCELIELTAKVQGDLYAILNITAAEGGHYAGMDTLKTRLLPWLERCFSTAKPSVTGDTTLQLNRDSVENDRRIRELSDEHESVIQQMGSRLCSRNLQLVSTRAELDDGRKEYMISCFIGLHVKERREAQKLLLRYIADLRMVQKIIFIAVVESFMTAKVAYKLRVRETLSTSSFGPEGLDAATVDFIVRNWDLNYPQSCASDVISAMNLNPWISFPPAVNFYLINDLIRETCRVAFAMQTLDPPLDLAFARDGEVYINSKYHRSYDSDLAAPLVMYHVWPALMEGNTVIAKGEAVTRRGALGIGSQSRSRGAHPVRSRSLSPTRSLAFNSRRSLSPERLTASFL